MIYSILLLLSIWLFIRILLPQLMSDIFDDKLEKLRIELNGLAIKEDGYFFESPLYLGIEEYINNIQMCVDKISIHSIILGTLIGSFRKREKIFESIKKNKAIEEERINRLILLHKSKNAEAFRFLFVKLSLYTLFYLCFKSLIITILLMISCIILICIFFIQYLYEKLFNASISFKKFIYTKIDDTVQYTGYLLSRLQGNVKPYL
jgi:hypothetical protein